MLLPRRILVIDDDRGTCQFIADFLSDEGYDVTTGVSGRAALDGLATFQPDLILLDLHMPFFSGQDFIDAYRALPNHHAPIVLMSARSKVETIARDLQADGYLFKPFEIDDLLLCVRQYLSASNKIEG
jgi:two-component system, OmpR family, response regulator